MPPPRPVKTKPQKYGPKGGRIDLMFLAPSPPPPHPDAGSATDK